MTWDPVADEIDAIGKARGSGFDSGSQEREQGLLQLLTEMDGFKRDDQVPDLATSSITCQRCLRRCACNVNSPAQSHQQHCC